MNRFRVVFLMAAITILGSGCSMMAPQYSPSLDNVQVLKDAEPFTARVGAFESNPTKDNPNSLSIRGSSLSSPYQGSYGAYLAAAINQELEFAKKLSQDSGVEITGAVLKNNIDASGFSTGTIDIQARFIVKRNGQARYNNVMMVHHEFPSSFAGAVAIPRAVQEYPVAVQRLLASLYADKAFINALK